MSRLVTMKKEELEKLQKQVIAEVIRTEGLIFLAIWIREAIEKNLQEDKSTTSVDNYIDNLIEYLQDVKD